LDYHLLPYLRLIYKVIMIPLFGSVFSSCFIQAIAHAFGAAIKLIATIEHVPDIDYEIPGRMKLVKSLVRLCSRKSNSTIHLVQMSHSQRHQHHLPGWQDHCSRWRI
jgi:hypothetical protein